MAIHEIQVKRKDGFGDPCGTDVAAEAKRTLGIDTEVKTTTIYRVEGPTDEQIKVLAHKAFVDPIVEQRSINVKSANMQDPSIEVSYKPGVTDPVAGTIQKVGQDLGISIEGARVSTVYEFEGITQEQADDIADRLLINKTVQQAVEEKPETLRTRGERGPITTVPISEANDSDLMEMSRDKLFLTLEEMQIVRDYFRKLERDPIDAELEIIAARWSEHCVHKTFNAKVIVDGVEKPSLFSRIKETSRKYFGGEVATAFEDNSGGMRFYDGQVVLVKWETHNSPSALEPKGGAATGSGGVFRDIMGTGQGAKVILSTDVFAVAPLDMDPSLLPPNCISPDILLRGVVAGVRDYGNPMGIPTLNGSVIFHEDFRAKPTVLVGAYGITPEKYAKKGEPKKGDRIVVIGGRTGRDGIHGATFSSAEMTERTATVNAAAVQIGNPIEEKKMADLILEARDNGFIRAITDCGAAGFSSAIGEMGENIGVNVDISRAPLKYEGLSPWEIWVSESQERMILAVSPENIDAFKQLCERFNVKATDLGYFDGSNRLAVYYGDEVVANLDYEFLIHGLPQRIMEAKFEREVFSEPEIPKPSDWAETFKKIMSHGNVCSKLPIVEQYDTTVQGGSALTPFGGVNYDAPNDAAIIRPILDKPYGMIVSHGTNPILNRIDPRRGAIWAATEAVSNLVAAGGDYHNMVLCGNYISPVPDKQYMGALDIMVDAIDEFEDAIERPVVSGKDSLSSTYTYRDGSKLHVPPVVNIATLGKIPDVDKKMTTNFKRIGSTVVLVGRMHAGMGGSTYYDINDAVGNNVPEVDLKVLPEVFDAIYEGIVRRDITACHDVSQGGIAGAIAEMVFGGDCGVELELDIETRPDFFLLNETVGMFIAEVENPEEAQRLFGNVPHLVLGKTTLEKKFSLKNRGEEIFEVGIDELKNAWQEPMRILFH